ncbi:MAG: hypothetical protein E7541_03005 [Ruminococcaceae bacterium]|nr:hypothetical protein [Oscillospiraceae bacterium]
MAGMSEAYDLELFRPREPRLVALQDNPKVAKDKKRRARRQSVLNVAVYLLIGLVVMGMVGYFITCNVRLTELGSAITEAQTELDTLHSERIRLQSELSGKTSAGQMEKYALENGMLPAQNSQIYYICASEEDLVEMTDDGQNWLERLWSSLFG